jgi:hypothetical protein
MMPYVGSESETAGADAKRTCATREIAVCRTKRPKITNSLLSYTEVVRTIAIFAR